MQKDLATSIGVAIIGVIAGYFVCNLFVGDIEPTSVKTVDASITSNLDNPDPEIFNYKALNPTVEVYVGNCDEYDESTGECLDGEIIDNDYSNVDPNLNQSDTTNNPDSDAAASTNTPPANSNTPSSQGGR